MYDAPKLIQGGKAWDDRGAVGFCNTFQFAGIQRFYTVENHAPAYIRAWHAHKIEHKYVLCIKGAANVAAVRVDTWDKPDPDNIPHAVTLVEHKADVFHIPAGYANGFQTLKPDTKLIFFSTANLQESLNDDYRFPWDYWNIWERWRTDFR